jgi:protein involved in polysaccharide export with SLBB domain
MISYKKFSIELQFAPTYRRLFAAITVAASMLCLPMVANAQGLSLGASLAGITAQDIQAAKSSLGGVMGLGGNTSISGILSPAIGTTAFGGNADVPEANTADKKESSKKANPLPPNEFQKYLMETTGKWYGLYGADFFENARNNLNDGSKAPVGDDYVLGVGDQLLVRVWGSTSGETQVTLDRNGEVSFPKMGTLKLAGVKSSHAEAVVKSLFARYYKDFELSVSLGRLRNITVFVVGQSRFPGSYALNSQATLTTGMFVSGGPNASGSIRRVQLKRQGVVLSEFDLYAFLSRGDKTADMKLQEGDVIFYPKASGFMAFTGKVNTPGVYEIKDDTESVADFLSLAGGLPIVADPRRATLERLMPALDQPRRLEEFALDAKGLQKKLQNGDVVSVAAIVPELANGITLRGNVNQPARFAWRAGMRVSDVISQKSLLMSPDSVRKQNELLFSPFEQERSARNRARLPEDLAYERSEEDKNELAKLKSRPQAPLPLPSGADANSLNRLDSFTDRSAILNRKSLISDQSLSDSIGGLVDEINLDYAVVERLHRQDLRVSLLPFNLGKVLANPADPDNLALEPGDVLTVFSANDIRIPISKKRVFVRLEGEVNKPGIYQILSGEDLSQLIRKAGGLTADAYLYGIGFYRDDVRKSQQENLDKLLRRLEAETSGSSTQASQSIGAVSDFGAAQAKVQSIQLAQKQSLERARSLKPEGRIALGVAPDLNYKIEALPNLKLNNGDRIYVPSRPDFVYIFGSVNTESAIIFKSNLSVADYLRTAGLGSGADKDATILMRADGSALTNQSVFRNDVLSATVMPGDTIVLPEKLDRESPWSYIVRGVKDYTQILYQLGLGAAAIKTLRQ